MRKITGLLLTLTVVVCACRKYEYGMSASSQDSQEVAVKMSILQQAIAADPLAKNVITAVGDAMVAVSLRDLRVGDSTAVYKQLSFTEIVAGKTITTAQYEAYARKLGFTSGAELTTYNMNLKLNINTLLRKYPAATFTDFQVAIGYAVGTNGDPAVCREELDHCVKNSKITYIIAMVGTGFTAAGIGGSTLGIGTGIAIGFQVTMGALFAAKLHNDIATCKTTYAKCLCSVVVKGTPPILKLPRDSVHL